HVLSEVGVDQFRWLGGCAVVGRPGPRSPGPGSGLLQALVDSRWPWKPEGRPRRAARCPGATVSGRVGYGHLGAGGPLPPGSAEPPAEGRPFLLHVRGAFFPPAVLSN